MEEKWWYEKTSTSVETDPYQDGWFGNMGDLLMYFVVLILFTLVLSIIAGFYSIAIMATIGIIYIVNKRSNKKVETCQTKPSNIGRNAHKFAYVSSVPRGVIKITKTQNMLSMSIKEEKYNLIDSSAPYDLFKSLEGCDERN